MSFRNFEKYENDNISLLAKKQREQEEEEILIKGILKKYETSVINKIELKKIGIEALREFSPLDDDTRRIEDQKQVFVEDAFLEAIRKKNMK